MTAIDQPRDLWSTMPGWGIVANLLPPEVISARRIRTIRKRMLIVLVAVVVLAGAGFGYAFMQARSAQNSLSAEQARTTQLLTQQHHYAAVTEIHSDVTMVNGQLSTLMAGDVDVPQLVVGMVAKLPVGASLSQAQVSLTSSSHQASSSASNAGSLDTSGNKHVGTVTLSGTVAHMADVATFVDGLNTLPGLVDVIPTVNTSSDKGSSFSIQLTLTDQVLSHRFDSGKAGK